MSSAMLPAWARWNEHARQRPHSVGMEEEVMLIDPATLDLASRVEDVLRAAEGTALAGHLARETHGSAVELRTDAFDDAAGAVAQLGALRSALRDALASIGLVPAAAGTHPCARPQAARSSGAERQREVHETMRGLASREPTYALHVHVAVAEPEEAVRAMNRLRAHVPLLLALSANSPYWQGRDSGLASARTPLFDAFPRSGLPREFPDYATLVATTDSLIGSGAIPEPSFIWWDVRLQPRYGTVEVRVMDAQTELAHTAALAALIRALVMTQEDPVPVMDEILAENRFRALRDGVDATFIDHDGGGLQPVADVLAECPEVTGIGILTAEPGPARQRAVARGGRDLTDVVADLVERF